MNVFELIFTDYTLKVVMFGAFFLGLSSGALGSFAVLRQQSLLGDAISHAALPGVAIIFLITQTKSPIVLLLGAGLAGWIGTLFVMAITRTTRIKRDAALGIVLAVFFGFGLVLLTIIQRLPSANKAGLDTYLFGSAATLLIGDVKLMAILGLMVLSLLIIFWKEFKLLTFDQDYAKSLGLPIRSMEIFLTTLIVVAIVIGLQTVGVVLMSAMLVAPAAAARQWTDRLSLMVLLSALFGALSGMAGAVTSSVFDNLPTGPTIVVYVSMVVLFSIFLAPHRGLCWDMIRQYRHRRSIRMNTMLRNLLLFSEIPNNPFHPHDLSALKAIGRSALNKTIRDLQKEGYVRQFEDQRWALTPQGFKKAKTLVAETESYQ